MPSVNQIIAQSPRHATIFAELEATRHAYHALVASVAPADWQRPSPNPAWTIGQLLDHIALVMHALPSDVRLIRRFGWIPRPRATVFDRLNILAVRLHALGTSPRLVCATYDHGHRRTLHVLAKIGETDWQRGAHYPAVDPFLTGFVTLERLFHYPAHHYLAHAVGIRQALGHPAASRMA